MAQPVISENADDDDDDDERSESTDEADDPPMLADTLRAIQDEDVSPDMRRWVSQYHDGFFEFDRYGLHVLHEIIAQRRVTSGVFDVDLYREAVRLTKTCIGNLEAKTTGERPRETTAFGMLCRSEFKAQGCDTSRYVGLIDYMIKEGADWNAMDWRRTTPVMLAAGAHNGAAFQYFIERAAWKIMVTIGTIECAIVARF